MKSSIAVLVLALFSSVCVAQNSALVLIDMQPYFSRIRKFDNFPGNQEKIKAVLQRQVELIRLAKARQWPIVVVEYEGCRATCDVLTREIGEYPEHKTFIKQVDSAF